ncbi:hypothetical protein [Couchioplanes caeruleus]|uniref:Uncharacterized protein n=1 Tax=Couchioplanes caeruleus subsp. caeruleus TaxID=56427 RepID=A0A1K0FPZ8_9ACTN|nr:hypothetical protein [Couchioplanes caeruleus]OJF14919.1 hypothetical protein BG844_07360 [Couchioplanes caeruleus subsp. caeruleus]
MNTTTDLILAGTLAAVWLAAGLVADVLPGAHTARALRQRTRALSMMAGAGVAVFVAVLLVTVLAPGESTAPAAALLPAVPALLVVTVTARRLTHIRRGVNAFATAPLAPAPPALLAAAAHPLVAAPLQVTGLAATIGVASVAGVIEVPGTGVTGGALTAAAVIVVVLTARHAVRHSRLSVAALAPLSHGRLHARPTAQPKAEVEVSPPVPAAPEVMVG